MTPPPRLQHAFHHTLGEKILSAKVDVEHFVELFRRDFEKGTVHGDTGVIDQTIYAAQKFAGLIGETRNLLQNVEVRLKRRGPASQRLHFFDGGLYPGIALDVMKDDIGALPRKFETDFMSDPCVGAGDQRFFSLQSEFLRHKMISRACEFGSLLARNALRVDGKPSSRCITITPETARCRARSGSGTLYVSHQNIVNNNVDYAEAFGDNSGRAQTSPS